MVLPYDIYRVQRYLLQVQLDKMYEVMVTAVNSEGENSKDLVTPTIIAGNVTKESDKSKYLPRIESSDIEQHACCFPFSCHLQNYEMPR